MDEDRSGGHRERRVTARDGSRAGSGAGGSDNPPAPEGPPITAQFERVTSVSFAFGDVVRRWIAPSAIGAALVRGRVAIENPVVAGLAGRGSHVQLFVIDSIITAREFKITAERSSAEQFAVKLAEIEGVLDASVGMKLRSMSGRDITFSGPRRLAFAFTCQRAAIDRDGDGVRLKTYEGNAAYARRPGHVGPPAPQPAVLTSTAALLT